MAVMHFYDAELPIEVAVASEDWLGRSDGDSHADDPLAKRADAADWQAGVQMVGRCCTIVTVAASTPATSTSRLSRL
jgi:hypothetical protein